ncbi:MAG: tetratricopeptide repeat protein [Anaerolineae bacterium]|nr:tetratricopeptide repeat protein [Anaerolineae bacterium]
MAQPELMQIGNRYRLHGKLGAGGMGMVYLATDRLTGDRVALKRVVTAAVADQFGADLLADYRQAEMRLALAHEFQLLASLRHPNIISVLDYGFDETHQPYFTMDLLEDAQTILTAGQDKNRAAQIDLLLQVLQALAYLHRRGVLHRDLKPGNVLVDARTGQVRVLDFGLSVSRASRHQTGVAGTMGTLAYMAPEVLDGENFSALSDLYAVGVIAYELMAGRHPFDTSNPAVLVSDIFSTLPDLSLIEHTGLSLVLQRLLAKDPLARFADDDEAIEALCRAVRRKPPQETPAIRESFLQAAEFVGRDAELARLEAALVDALTGRGSAWLVGGESGVGKSRLLNELRTRAMVQGAVTLYGQGVAEGGRPYQLWREPVRRLALAAELTDLEASILKEIVPDIGDLLGRAVPDAPEMEASAAQQRLLLTIAALFRKAVARQPVVLLLEDLQWAVESLEPLKQLQRWQRHAIEAGEPAPLLIVGSYRDDERPGLPEAISADAPPALIRLERLSPAAIAELSESMLGEAGRKPQVLDLLQRETEGNVFFLVEVVRVMAQEAGGLSNIGRETLPETVFAGGVQKIIQRRFARVPDAHRPLLKLAAVVGRELNLAILRRVEPDADFETWLTTCANVAVLEPVEQRWRFAHDKIREALLVDLSDAERRTLNRRVAEAIEAVYPGDADYVAVLVKHWRAAGDRAKTAHYTHILGEQYLSVSALRDALEAFEQALAAIPAQDASTRAEVHAKMGITYHGMGDFPAGGRHFEAALKLARVSGNRQIELRSLRGMAAAAWWRGDEAAGRDHLEECLALARAAGAQAAIAGALGAMGVFERQRGCYGAARQYHEEELAIYRALGDTYGVADALNNLGGIYWTLGSYEDAKRYREESLALFKQLGDRRGISIAVNNLGNIAWLQGRYADAEAYYQESLAIAREISSRGSIGVALNNLGGVTTAQGKYGEALHYYERALAVRHDIGDLRGIASTLSDMGHLYTEQGELGTAWRYLKDALRRAVETGAIPFVVRTLVRVGAVYARADEYERAAAFLGLTVDHPALAIYARQLDVEPLFARLRTRLAPVALDAALARGGAMGLDAAVSAVLSDS